MAPTLGDGQVVVVSRHAYRRRKPRRGELVAARPRPLQGTAMVKRLAGLPHDRITVSGRHWQLGDDQYFLLGDRADDSLDSRRLGPMSREELIGPLCARLWPPTFFCA